MPEGSPPVDVSKPGATSAKPKPGKRTGGRRKPKARHAAGDRGSGKETAAIARKRGKGAFSAPEARVAKPKPGKRTSGLPNGFTAKSGSGNGMGPPVEHIRRVPLRELASYAGNPRAHSPEQIDHIAASMREFGQTTLLVVDGDGPNRGELIAGHARLLAAQQLGWESLVVGEARGWTAEQKRAYRIADNQLALISTWDAKLLKLELADLKLASFDLNLLGFGEADLSRWITGDYSAVNAVISPPGNPIVRPGELWILGEHRILCGNALDASDVATLLGGEKPHLVVSDPPYGVKYDPTWRVRRRPAYIATAGILHTSIGKVRNDDCADWQPAWKLSGADVCYIWHASSHVGVSEAALRNAGYDIRAQIVWRKPMFAISRGDYHWQHECCWYAVRRGAKSHWQGDRKQTTVWDIAGSGGIAGAEPKLGHGTQKPIECMRRPIENSSKPGDLVYDPFVGTGTTIIAADLAKRRCLALDIDAAYVQVSIERWEKSSGKQATLDGQPYAEIKQEREAKKEARPKPRRGASLGTVREDQSSAGG